MRPDRRQSHPGSVLLLDLLEGRLSPVLRRATEAHLGLPCSACRDRLLAMAELTGRMRADRMEAVPDSLSRAAIAAFAPNAGAAERAEASPWRRLVLAFDSLAQPLAAHARRAVGESRRLRFELEGLVLEIESDPESGDQCSLRGRLHAHEPELHRLEARVGDERARRWVESGGAFHFEGLPRGTCHVTVSGPEGRFETPPFET